MDAYLFLLIWGLPILPLISFLTLISLNSAPKSYNVWISGIATGFSFIVSIILARFLNHTEGYSRSVPWIDLSSLQIDLGVDLNFEILLIMSFVFISTLYFYHKISWTNILNNGFYAYMSLAFFATFGLMVSPNLFQFYFFWGLLNLANFLIISEQGGKASQEFGLKDVTLFIAIAYLYYYMPGTTLDFNQIQNLLINHSTAMPESAIRIFSLFVLVSIMGQTGLWPFKSKTSPQIYFVVPNFLRVAASFMLFYRLAGLFQSSIFNREALLYAGLVSAIIAMFFSLIQRRLREMLAFAAVSFLGEMVASFATGVSSLSLFYVYLFFVQYSFVTLIKPIGKIKAHVILKWFVCAWLISCSTFPPFLGYWLRLHLLDYVWKSHRTATVLIFVLMILSTLLALRFFQVGWRQINWTKKRPTILFICLQLLSCALVAMYVQKNGFVHWRWHLIYLLSCIVILAVGLRYRCNFLEGVSNWVRKINLEGKERQNNSILIETGFEYYLERKLDRIGELLESHIWLIALFLGIVSYIMILDL